MRRVFRYDSTEIGRQEAQRLNNVIRAKNRADSDDSGTNVHRQAMIARENGHARNFASADDARAAMMQRQETNPSRQHN